MLLAAQIGGPNLAVIDNPSSGPQFGAEGLTIRLQPIPKGDERVAKTKLVRSCLFTVCASSVLASTGRTA